MDALWLVPALPLAGFLVLVFGALRPRAAAIVGVASVGLSFAVALFVTLSFLRAPPLGAAFRQTLWTWVAIDGFTPRIAYYLDPLAIVMMLVITGVGFLIHWYSVGFMRGEEGFGRFFAYMNLFVSAMLTLVLGDNLLLLYLGWEGVGLCSYLLIGFWYREAANGRAARKAFVVTRIGDTAMLLGLLLLFTQLGTLDIQTLMTQAAENWAVGAPLAILAAALLLGGALGKSAQLPLQTWLPDAMAGPTPVSALIHAATMVTAGVYLIARTHVLFALAPPVQFAVAIIGAATLLLAAASALNQSDIKRVLAYSTMSQIGYMFLALGVSAWSAAIFHFMTHAFFKALLFLSAGIVTHALHHEHDIFKMGGLRQRLPAAFWCFGIGAASLSALPLVTAGFYSKDTILAETFAAPHAGAWLWAAAWVGALVTPLYSFRLYFIAFFGVPKTVIPPGEATPRSMLVPVIVLAVLAVVGGFVNLPPALGDFPLLFNFLAPVLPSPPHALAPDTELRLEILGALGSLAGLYLAWHRYQWRKALGPGTPALAAIARFWYAGWGFDTLYDRSVVRPFLALAAWWRADFFDALARGVTQASRAGNALLAHTQTGHLRWYAASLAAGAVLVVALALLP